MVSMEELEEEKITEWKIGKLAILPQMSRIKGGVGIGLTIGSGVFWQSVRIAVSVLFWYIDIHFVWDNKLGEVVDDE